MTASPNEKTLPLLVRFAVFLSVLGFAFPIYGYSLPLGFKLTLWRVGLLLLLPITLSYGLKLRTRPALRILVLFMTLGLLRFVSLITTDDRQVGTEQLTWFTEGVLFLAAVTSLSSQLRRLPAYFLRTVFYISAMSTSVMALQLVMVYFGVLFTLPLSTSVVGFPEALRPWTYPLYGGGRILGAFMDPNMSGSMCAFFVAAFFPFLFVRSKARPLRRSVIAVSLLITCVALIGTGSRQSAVATVLTVAVTMFTFSLHNLRATRKILLGILVFSVLLVPAIFATLPSEAVTTPFGEVQESIFVRMTQPGSDTAAVRLFWMEDILSSMDVSTFVFGIGEGRGVLTAHNAYVIMLNENGVMALGLLIVLSVLLLLETATRMLARGNDMAVGMGVASFCVSLTWIALIFINWAQLNQEVSYLYMAIPLLFLNGYKGGSVHLRGT